MCSCVFVLQRRLLTTCSSSVTSKVSQWRASALFDDGDDDSDNTAVVAELSGAEGPTASLFSSGQMRIYR